MTIFDYFAPYSWSGGGSPLDMCSDRVRTQQPPKDWKTWKNRFTSPKLVRTANSKGIWIFNAYPFFKIENNKLYLSFSTPFPYGSQFGQLGNIPDIASIMRTIGTDYIELK